MTAFDEDLKRFEKLTWSVDGIRKYYGECKDMLSSAHYVVERSSSLDIDEDLKSEVKNVLTKLADAIPDTFEDAVKYVRKCPSGQLYNCKVNWR